MRRAHQERHRIEKTLKGLARAAGRRMSLLAMFAQRAHREVASILEALPLNWISVNKSLKMR
jgi:hypothetical protein